MEKYRLINGKVCDLSGNPVPLEFGNADQIAFIKRCQDRADAFRNDGVALDVYHVVHHTAEALLNCVCGHRMWIEHETEDEEDIEPFEGHERVCYKCNSKYVLTINDDGEVIATLSHEKDS